MTTKKSKTPSSMSIEELVSEINKMGVESAKKPRTEAGRDRYAELWNEYLKKAKAYRTKQKQKYNKAAKKATNLNEGDRVEYSFVSPFGFSEFLTGIVVKYRGKLQVRLDEKFSNKRYTPIHKGWKRTKK